MLRGEIMPTDPRVDWDVAEAVSVKNLAKTLKSMSKDGWLVHAYLKSSRLHCWDIVFWKVEQIGEPDRADELMKANLPPYQGAVRVND